MPKKAKKNTKHTVIIRVLLMDYVYLYRVSRDIATLLDASRLEVENSGKIPGTDASRCGVKLIPITL